MDYDHDSDTITLDELRRGGRPMTVLERVETGALTLPIGSLAQLGCAKLFLAKTQPDLSSTAITQRQPLEDMKDSELLATLKAIRGYLAAQGAGVGVDEGADEARLTAQTH